MRCTLHDLAAGPDGRCVVCRRGDPAAKKSLSPAPLASVSASTHGGFAVIGKSIGVVVGAFALLAIVSGGVRAAVGVSARPAEAIAAPAFPPKAPRAPRLPRLPRSPQIATRPDLPVATTDDRGGEGDAPDAVKGVSITIYTTSWCPHCTHAKAWMREKGLSYVERDVEADPDAKARARALNPSGGVPLIDVEGEIVRGFNERALAAAIGRAAQRHL